MKKAIVFLFILFQLTGYAQNERKNWYFGKYAAITFSSGAGTPKHDNPQYIYGPVASFSDPVTGRFLFYSNGQTIWNSSFSIMPNGSNIAPLPVGDLVAFPVPGSTSKYYLFITGNNAPIHYITIDMSLNGGTGAVTGPATALSTQIGPQLAVIRYRYADAVWVIVHEINNSRFKAFLVDSSGVSATPVVSDVGLPVQNYGDMAGSNLGDKLVVTHFLGNDNRAEIFDFDRVCGRLSRPVLLPRGTDQDYPYGIAFSANDSMLYISYSYARSYIVQYSGTDYQRNYTIASAPDNYNIMRLGPDNRIYITTHDGGVPGPRMDVILQPERLAGLCDYRKTFFSLDEGAGRGRSSAFELPSFATGKKAASPTAAIRDSIFTASNTCFGDTVQFRFLPVNPFDSIVWHLGEPGAVAVNELTPQYHYASPGNYQVSLTIYRCGKAYLFTDTLRIESPPYIHFPPEIFFCKGKQAELKGPDALTYQWSTNETTQTVFRADTGLVWLRAANGDCAATDSVQLKNYPDLVTLLGPEYFLCEDDEELVKLDAGEGFTHYKWTPTEDTMQWIIVRTTGDYFVKVTDHYGCIGDDATRVKRQCGVIIHFPDAFTPNGDGLNDVYAPIGLDVIDFTMVIYNRWGEKVFTSVDLGKGWDGTYKGKPAADGVYTYLAEYTGFRNKRKQTFSKKGKITLLR